MINDETTQYLNLINMVAFDGDPEKKYPSARTMVPEILTTSLNIFLKISHWSLTGYPFFLTCANADRQSFYIRFFQTMRRDYMFNNLRQVRNEQVPGLFSILEIFLSHHHLLVHLLYGQDQYQKLHIC
jgi:hypothetical protein